MTNPFASALDAIFHAPGSEAAEHVSVNGQVTRDVRVIRSQGDREAHYGNGPMIMADRRVEIRRSQLPMLQDGDELTIGTITNDEFIPSENLILTGEPMSDTEAMTWVMGYEIRDVSR
ncbi:head-tail joining protein [Sphingobium sp. RAC03]|uniref:head-tail joining protein n=1 Tax=Sphingobium sp. RAC03 TaxID=1843368 RepID=UPI00083E03C1|nr:hypothetical protein [Sphingobium sp. RAC03]AOF96521.1 hypothetical protein BSY17_2646 [Sphingobium sp. RAC03]